MLVYEAVKSNDVNAALFTIYSFYWALWVQLSLYFQHSDRTDVLCHIAATLPTLPLCCPLAEYLYFEN